MPESSPVRLGSLIAVQLSVVFDWSRVEFVLKFSVFPECSFPGPLARKRILFLDFFCLHFGISRAQLGYIRQNKTHGTYDSTIPQIPSSLARLVSSFQISYVLFYIEGPEFFSCT